MTRRPPSPLWLRAGTTLRATIAVEDDQGVVDLTGVQVTLQVAPQPGATPGFSFDQEPAVVVDGPAGTVELAVPASATAQMTGYHGHWQWSLTGTWPGLDAVELAAGPLTITGQLVTP